MNTFLNFKVITVIIIILVISFTAVILTTKPNKPQSTPIPFSSIQPTSFPILAQPSIPPSPPINQEFNTYSEGYLNQQEEITNQEQSMNDRAVLVSKFIDKLPHLGQTINVTYSIHSNQIYLEYSKSDKDQALQEFVNLLKSNQIENINWLYNLHIIER